MISPPDTSSGPDLFRVLTTNVTDNDDKEICVEMYASDIAPSSDDLVYKSCVANNTMVTYNLTTLPFDDAANTEIIWHFDNSSLYGENDTHVYDFATLTTNHNRSCSTTCPDWTTAGKMAGAFNYTGSDRWQMTEQYFNDEVTTRSYQLWVKPSDLVGTETLYEEGGGTNGLGIRLVGNQLQYAVRNGGAGSQVTITATFPDTEWHLITAQFDAGNMTLYIDDALESTTASGHATIGTHGNEAGLGATESADCFGTSATGNYFTGLIDEMRILNVELTEEEVEESYSLVTNQTYHWFVNATDPFIQTSSPTWEFTIKTSYHIFYGDATGKKLLGLGSDSLIDFGLSNISNIYISD